MNGIQFHGTLVDFLTIAAGGAFGALVKDAVQDGSFQLPYFQNGKLILGVIGATLIGAFVGLAIDGSFVTAALGGYVGISLVSNLLPGQSRESIDNQDQTKT